MIALSEASHGLGMLYIAYIAQKNSDIDMRKKAIFWLGDDANDAKAIETLSNICFNDADGEIRKEEVFALSNAPDELGMAELIKIARTHPDYEIRKTAIFWLGESSDPRARDALFEIINSNQKQ